MRQSAEDGDVGKKAALPLPGSSFPTFPHNPVINAVNGLSSKTWPRAQTEYYTGRHGRRDFLFSP